ncbi:MAG: Gfo/Idh/MocA family oxidoreductase [Pirellulaceae bacterium]|jgi:predicted dehydrogenase|nr:Gfo/Idh/MocA family oxidoreductase [Pirellulaceae bacterium]
MSKTIGVLVHGAGWVSTQHIAALQRNPHTEVVAICSKSLEGARQRALEQGLRDIEVYNDLGRALEQPEVDAVAICTPQHLHCENVVQAARAGKHLIIEKPIGISLAELQRIRDAVQAAGVKTVVSFVLRWNPLFRLLKSLIHDGAIGRPYYVEADYLSHNGSWWSGWNEARTQTQGVSALLVGGCHAVDALRWFAASGEYEAARPVEVFAMSGGYRKGTTREYNPLTNTWLEHAPPMEYDGVEAVLVRFDNGVFGKVTVNADCIMPYRFPLRIFGDRGTVFDNRIWSHKFPGQTDWITLPSILPDSSDVKHHPFQAEIDHFADCVLRDVESHCNLQDALSTHEVVFAAQQCYQTGRPVTLPLI